ncbi:MAG: holo-ACP synthase [Anaerolineaceae bacterium]|jgi:holo-[acyl-carrier-protein] synthase
MIKCGVDIVRINRLEEINPAIRARFIQRVYTSLEQTQLGDSPEALAGVFAAKEAVSKALGTGIGKVHWQHIEIIHAQTGEPEVRLHAQALHTAQSKNLNEWAVSISHDGGYAIAMAVAQT